MFKTAVLNINNVFQPQQENKSSFKGGGVISAPKPTGEQDDGGPKHLW